MTFKRFGAAFVAIACWNIPALAAERLPPPGAASCTGCHAAGTATAIPPLQGRPAVEIAEAMRAYRSGERPATVMDRIAKGFTEEETAAIAGWLAGRR
jgi:cytochrome subunit of sulfide dehydrogenase